MSAITAPKLASVLLLGSLACGCLRIGYRELDGARANKPDAGTSNDPDASTAAVSGRGGGSESGSIAAAMGGMVSRPAGATASGTGGQRAGGAGGGSGTSPSGSGGDSGLSGGAGGSGGTSTLMDAGTTDAGSDAGTDAATQNNRCPERTDAVLCDNFDDGLFNRWDYKLDTYGVLSQSTSPVRSGGSLHAATTRADLESQARWCASVLDKQKSGDIWLRYYNYLPSSVVITSHFSSGVISELQEPYWGVWTAVQSNRVDIGTSFDSFYQGDQAFPRDRWVCVELHIKVDPTAGQLELFLDGTRVAYSPNPLNTVPAMGYTNAEVGIHYAETTQGPVEVYTEDVVLARQRVPCQ